MSLKSALRYTDTLCAIIGVLIMLNSTPKCKSQTNNFNNVSLHGVPVITDVQRRYNWDTVDGAWEIAITAAPTLPSIFHLTLHALNRITATTVQGFGSEHNCYRICSDTVHLHLDALLLSQTFNVWWCVHTHTSSTPSFMAVWCTMSCRYICNTKLDGVRLQLHLSL